MPSKKTYPLTLYLLKEEFTELAQFVQSGLNKVEINDLGTFFYRGSHKNIPKWISLFDGYNFPLFSSSASGLLLVKIKNRFFAITFGPEGRHFLNKGVTEERFGLITTLNSVKENSIRSVDTKTLESEGLQTRIQSARPVSADIFGLDVEKDLLNCIVGEPEDSKLGKILSGRDSLRVSVKCDLDDLKSILEIILRNYQKDNYREKFPWIDNLKEIRNSIKVDELNQELVSEINKELPEKIWLTIPEILDWNDHGGFKYSKKRNAEVLDDIHIKTFKSNLGKDSINLDDLKNHYIFHFLQSSEESNDHWRVYDCIYFEYSKDNETYFLTSGKWYAVDIKLVNEVNNYYAVFPSDEFSILFPDYNHEKEVSYNKELADKNSALFLDGQTIRIEGRNSFEFCDVYTENKQIIHVKRYSGSNVLSHLFNQGYVSANFLLDEDFREKINDKLLSAKFKIQDIKIRPNSIADETYAVIFGIISKTRHKLDIPFFSKMTLMHVSKSLRNLGFKVSLVKIKNVKFI